MYRYTRSYQVNKLYSILSCKYINVNKANHHHHHHDYVNRDNIVRHLSSSRNNDDNYNNKSLRSSRLIPSTFDDDDHDLDDLSLKPSDEVNIYEDDDDDDDFFYDAVEDEDIDDINDDYDDRGDDKNDDDNDNDDKDDFSLDQYHDKFYPTQDLNNFNQLSYYPPANYADITTDEIKKYFPEGFAGELKDEFKFLKNGNDDDNDNNNKWMIRDSTKFLFRLIDEYDLHHQQKQHRKNNSTSSSKMNNSAMNASSLSQPLETTPRLIHSPIEFDGLTNRQEWYDTIQRIESYGTELLDRPKSSTKKLSHSRSFPLSSSFDMENLDSNDSISKYLDKLMGTNRDATVDKFPNRILLAGERGVGKSVVLNQAVYYARKKGWLCIFVPQGWEQVQGGSYVEPAIFSKEDSINFTLPFDERMKKFQATDISIFDNHEQSTEVLRGFLLAHSQHLHEMKINKDELILIVEKYLPYIENYKEKYQVALLQYMDGIIGSKDNLVVPFLTIRALVENDENIPAMDKKDENILKNFDINIIAQTITTIEDLIILGIALRDLSGSIFIDIMKILKEQDEIPILIAVDQYNTWEVNSAYSNNNVMIKSKNLCIPHCLNFLRIKKNDPDQPEWNLKLGLSIATTSMKYLEGRNVTYKQYKKSIPLMITIPNYNSVEYLSVMTHYRNNNAAPKYLYYKDFLGYRMFTGSNPRLIRNEMGTYMNPLVYRYINEWTNEIAEGTLKNPDKKKILDDLDAVDDDDEGDSYDGEDGDTDGNDENKRLGGGGYDDKKSKKKSVVSKKSKVKASANDDDELDDIFNQMTSGRKK